jgi:hypothetical protein
MATPTAPTVREEFFKKLGNVFAWIANWNAQPASVPVPEGLETLFTLDGFNFATCKGCYKEVPTGPKLLGTVVNDFYCKCYSTEWLEVLDKYLWAKHEQERRTPLVHAREGSRTPTPEDSRTPAPEDIWTPDEALRTPTQEYVPTFGAEEPCAPWTPPEPTKEQEKQRIEDSNICPMCKCSRDMLESNYGILCSGKGKCKVQGSDEE